MNAVVILGSGMFNSRSIALPRTLAWKAREFR